jgi:uncharacterized protein (TIGR03437 family)
MERSADYRSGEPPGGPIPDDAIRAQLARMLHSRPFAQAPRCGEFLGFVVEQKLAGRTYEICAESIRQRLYPKALGQACVRAAAGRLRSVLDRYYKGDGLAEPIRIGIPVNTYEPDFTYQQPPPLTLVPVTRVTASAGDAIPKSARAFELFCEGRRLWSERRPDRVALAIVCFEEAIREEAKTGDQPYAAAYAALADCYTSGIASAQTFPLPLQLQGTSVTVNGIPAPLLAVANVSGSEQINFQVPFETATPGQARIVVSSGGRDSAPIDVPALSAKPAVFVVGGIGAAVVHGSTGALVTATNPVLSGEVVVIYCTGLGPVTPQVPTGSAAPTTTLSQVVLPFAVTVGGRDAVVDFAGLAPTFAGLYQINVEVPADLTGTSVPLVIQVNGSSSLPVSLPIAQ